MDSDTAPAGLVRAMVPDALGEWLPAALADMLIAVLSMWGASQLRRSEVLRSWGIPATEEQESDEAAEERKIEAVFDRLEKQGKHGKSSDTD